MNRYMVGVEHPDALVYLAFSERVAQQAAQMLTTKYKSPAKVMVFEDEDGDFNIAFRGPIVIQWHKFSIEYVDSENHTLIATFYPQDVDLLMGRMKAALDDGNQDVIFLDGFCYPMSFALERKHVEHLRNQMRANIELYREPMQANLKMNADINRVAGQAGQLVARLDDNRCAVVRMLEENEISIDKKSIN